MISVPGQRPDDVTTVNRTHATNRLYRWRRRSPAPRHVDKVALGVSLRCRVLRLLCALGALGHLPALAEEAKEGAPRPAQAPDLYQAVAHFSLDLEMLRWVAGSQKVEASPWVVSRVAPRHLLWQAQVMFRKASSFAEEVANAKALPLPPGSWRRTQPRQPPLGREPQLVDALRVVVDAHDRIRAAIELQNIRMVEGLRPEPDSTKTAGDVLALIVQNSRQLNLLLHREAPPRDAYNRVMAAVERAADLLGGTYPPVPPLVTGQRPDDAYRRLVTCLGLLQQAAAKQGIPTLNLDLDRELARQDVSDADVYHLATALLSDLEYMTQLLGRAATKPPRGEYPRLAFVFPSHIHQIAGVLETQLRTLASTEPDALPADAATKESPVATPTPG